MDLNLIKETIDLPGKGKMTFTQSVRMLMREGIESYHVDLLRSENRYYLPGGVSHWELVPHRHAIKAASFYGAGVAEAANQVLRDEINYEAFMDKIINAGCVYYIVYLTGKRVLYLGREGDFHVEYFPKVI